LLPALAVLVVLLALPLLLVAVESLRVFVPGRVGSMSGSPLTLENYAALIDTAYLGYFLDTFRISLIASLIALVLGMPIAYRIAHLAHARRRRLWIGFLAALLFLNVLVRVYGIALAMGPAGFGRDLASLLGTSLNGRPYIELAVVAGLLHCLIPMAALTLVGPMQNLNPRLIEAAQVLGTPLWKAHVRITLPLSAKPLLSAFMLCFTFCLSAFVIPLILGKGRILFVSNLVYNRFGEVGNFPGGAAIALVLLLVSLAVVYAISRITTRRLAS
jgi:putative spermidine/putrescine transport system permease protein